MTPTDIIASLTDDPEGPTSAEERAAWRDEPHIFNLVWEKRAWRLVEQLERAEAALKGIRKAWDSLPEGRHTHRPVNDWMRERMKPAMQQVRAALGVTE